MSQTTINALVEVMPDILDRCCRMLVGVADTFLLVVPEHDHSHQLTEGPGQMLTVVSECKDSAYGLSPNCHDHQDLGLQIY